MARGHAESPAPPGEIPAGLVGELKALNHCLLLQFAQPSSQGQLHPPIQQQGPPMITKVL